MNKILNCWLLRVWWPLKVHAARFLSRLGVHPQKGKVLVNDCPAWLWCRCGVVYDADPCFYENVVWSEEQGCLVSVCPRCGFRAP